MKSLHSVLRVLYLRSLSGFSKKKKKMRAALVLFLAPLSVKAAVEADEVQSLPGWDNKSLVTKMYSGFIEPASNPSHHIHYLFVESERDPTNDPVVLWVQGGPGGSSLEGAFTENMSPYQISDESLATSPPTLLRSLSSWTGIANMLFWEAPSGVGFSYCDAGCPSWNDTTSAQEQASFICEWLAAFPEYQSNDFFITGESYAGVYIPTTAHVLLEEGCASTNGAAVNLKGVAVGNGCTGTDAGTCSPQRSVNTFEELAAQGFVSWSTAAAVRSTCEDSAGFTAASSACQDALVAASAEAGPFNNYNVHDTCSSAEDGSTLLSFICDETPGAQDWACAAAGLPPPSIPAKNRFEGPRGKLYGSLGDGSEAPRSGRLSTKGVNSTQRSGAVSENDVYAETYPCNTEDALSTWLSDASVMDALHVTASGQGSWPGSGIRYTRTAKDLISPAALDGYVSLIDAGLRVLIYSGDFDGQVPHFGTEQWTRDLGYPLAKGCEGWRPWSLDASSVPAGHFVQYEVPGEFTYLTIARAGHMVPAYKPAEALAMIQRFLDGGDYTETSQKKSGFVDLRRISQ